MQVPFNQIAAEIKAKRQARQKRLSGFIDAIQAKEEKQPDIKIMRELLSNIHNALPLAEGPVKDTFDKEPRVFFATQQEFENYIKDRPFYWPDKRVENVYNLLLKINYKEKDKNTLIRLKNIFTLIK